MAALMIDSLILFNKEIHPLIGKDINKLFGINGISLNKSEIYINSKKGINCAFEKNDGHQWPLGQLILNKILNVTLTLNLS